MSVYGVETGRQFGRPNSFHNIIIIIQFAQSKDRVHKAINEQYELGSKAQHIIHTMKL